MNKPRRIAPWGLKDPARTASYQSLLSEFNVDSAIDPDVYLDQWEKHVTNAIAATFPPEPEIKTRRKNLPVSDPMPQPAQESGGWLVPPRKR